MGPGFGARTASRAPGPGPVRRTVPRLEKRRTNFLRGCGLEREGRGAAPILCLNPTAAGLMNFSEGGVRYGAASVEIACPYFTLK